MIANFKLNVANAKAVGDTGYISKSGPYTGVIKLARLYDTNNGATMLVLEFVTNGSEHVTISMPLTKINGEETFNRKIVDALMTVLKVREMSVVQGQYLDQKENVMKPAYLLNDLMNKPVGLLLQNAPEEYEDRTTRTIKVANRMNLLTPFDPQTMQTARELLEKKEAKYVQNKAATLKDKEVKKFAPTNYSAGFERPPQAPINQGYQQAPQSYQQPAQGYQQPPQSAPAMYGSEEDIPF